MNLSMVSSPNLDTEYYERKFNGRELEKLRLDFQFFSKDGKIGRSKILEYFGLQELDVTPLATRFLDNLRDKSKSLVSTGSMRGGIPGTYMLNYESYIKAMGILLRGEPSERLEFIYSFFDVNKEGRVEYFAMLDILYQFYSTLIRLSFENLYLNLLKSNVKLTFS